MTITNISEGKNMKKYAIVQIIVCGDLYPRFICIDKNRKLSIISNRFRMEDLSYANCISNYNVRVKLGGWSKDKVIVTPINGFYNANMITSYIDKYQCDRYGKQIASEILIKQFITNWIANNANSDIVNKSFDTLTV